MSDEFHSIQTATIHSQRAKSRDLVLCRSNESPKIHLLSSDNNAEGFVFDDCFT